MADRATRHDFVKDQPKERRQPVAPAGNWLSAEIAGCEVTPLLENRDHRGGLVELLTLRDGNESPIVHVYQVFAAPNSLRGWVYHDRQFDRLAFTNGRFRIVLHDLREDSPTFRVTATLLAGHQRAVLLRIPSFVAHSVQNLDDQGATFVNLPTRAYDHADPDKFRLPIESGLIEYDFTR